MIGKILRYMHRVLSYVYYKYMRMYRAIYMDRIVLYAMYLISYVTPRSRNIWVFGAWSGIRFADNPKYLFLYVKSEHPEIRPIWLTRDVRLAEDLNREGYEAYKRFSVKGWLYSMKAGCVIVSNSLPDVNRFAVGGAKKVRLFHGTVLKKGFYDDQIHSPIYPKRRRTDKVSTLDKVKFYLERKLAPPLHYDMYNATSEESKDKLSSAYRFSKNRIYVTGHPRNDAMFDTTYLDSNRCDYLDNVRNKVEFREVYAYLPTFRDALGGKLDLFGKHHFEIEEIQQILERRNAILIMKAHSGPKLYAPDAIDKSARIYNPSYAELPDIYPLLKETDILITDYSGVYFDYLLLNRPIIFAPFDIDYYTKECRELYYDYNEVTPGPKARDWREVFSHIEEELKEDHWQQEREAVCRCFNKFIDNKSSERVFKLVKDLVWGSPH